MSSHEEPFFLGFLWKFHRRQNIFIINALKNLSSLTMQFNFEFFIVQFFLCLSNLNWKRKNFHFECFSVPFYFHYSSLIVSFRMTLFWMIFPLMYILKIDWDCCSKMLLSALTMSQENDLKFLLQKNKEYHKRVDEGAEMECENDENLITWIGWLWVWRKCNWILKLQCFFSLFHFYPGSLLSFVDRRRAQRAATFLRAEEKRRIRSWCCKASSCQSTVRRRK